MIVGFWCSTCCEVADEDHYQPWSPCESGITVGHIRNIMTHGEGRPTTGWSVTQLKGCLRATIIERTEDCIVDPANYLLMELGSAWDDRITRYEGEKVRWRGTLGGLEISGEPDGWALREHDTSLCCLGASADTIWDYKNGVPPRTDVWPDHRWQVSLYAFIGPYIFDHGYIYYNSYGGKAGKVCKRRFDLIRSEEALLSHKVATMKDANGEGGAIHDVALNVTLATKLDGRPAAQWPLTGQHIPMGRKVLCDYCVVRDKCEELDNSV